MGEGDAGEEGGEFSPCGSRGADIGVRGGVETSVST